MGIVADLQNTTFTSQTPKNSIPMGAISNIFICVMHAFQISFGFKFDPNPKKGVGGSPASRQLWEIGIVQNVLYDMLNFTYSDGSNFRVEFKDPVLDSVAAIHPPFYHDPVYVKGCDIDPLLKCNRYIPLMVPVVDINYTTKGYGELLDPWDPSGVAITNSPQSVDMLDEPSFGARLRLKNGAIITRAEQILSFQTWLVAKTSDQTHVLAHYPPFSLVFWLTTNPSPNLLSIGTPQHDFAYYGENGMAKIVRQSGGEVKIRPQLGSGSKNPVMGGMTANERGISWLKSNSLLPDS